MPIKRLLTAILAAAVLTLTAACGDPIPAGTVTGKAVLRNPKNNATCYWIKVRHDDGSTSKGCISARQWKKVRKGDRWSGQ